ncbi:AAA family ATPase [Pseudarthrobacter sp. H2]|uniref:phosphatase domain-containing protein n=1 Tax=Pseudarthrobacter sp. H2 TaxID=3418415 RepID=UPI003CED4D6B
MPKLLMLKGLPASGKSTFAKELASQGWVRTNKDDLRAMLNASKWSKGNEKFVLKLRDHIIRSALTEGKNVVVDDTNFAPSHEVTLKTIAQDNKASFETKYFDTPLDECIKRDLARSNSVGEAVIRKMYNEFLKPAPDVIEHDSSLPGAVICDIDGTLAHMVNRGPYDTSKYLDDEKDDLVHWAFARLSVEGGKRIICSGRSDEFRADTEQWLADNGITYDLLLMRPAGDVRKDSIVKRELYEQHIKGQYNVRLVLDDRNQVVDMWRDELGLKCFQVAPGDF